MAENERTWRERGKPVMTGSEEDGPSGAGGDCVGGVGNVEGPGDEGEAPDGGQASEAGASHGNAPPVGEETEHGVWVWTRGEGRFVPFPEARRLFLDSLGDALRRRSRR